MMWNVPGAVCGVIKEWSCIAAGTGVELWGRYAQLQCKCTELGPKEYSNQAVSVGKKSECLQVQLRNGGLGC